MMYPIFFKLRCTQSLLYILTIWGVCYVLDRFNLNHMKDETCFDSVGTETSLGDNISSHVSGNKNKTMQTYLNLRFCSRSPVITWHEDALNCIGISNILQRTDHKSMKCSADVVVVILTEVMYWHISSK
jgi:hypothetical protein